MSTGADAFVCKMMLTMVFHGDLPDLVVLYSVVAVSCRCRCNLPISFMRMASPVLSGSAALLSCS